MKIISSLQKQSENRINTIGATFIVLIGLIDYITGYEISFSVFYLIPISIIAWFTGNRRAIALSVLMSAVVWLLVDQLSGQTYSSVLIPFWNAGVRLGFFLIVALTLSSLRDANHQREELASFIVHDLRSPLSNSLSGLEYLLEISGEKLDDVEQELVRLSLASSNRMLTLVNSLLDLAKLEDGQMKLNLQLVPVTEIFDTAAQQVAAMATRGDVEVSSEILPGAEQVTADRELVIRVLVNLISNALKYSPSGSTVLVQAAPHHNHQVSIQVIDHGAGIPKEWTDKVFDKFAQVGARKQGIAIGSGLGLTFCRLAIEAHGGRIWLTSELDQGTTVTLTLPQNPDQAQTN